MRRFKRLIISFDMFTKKKKKKSYLSFRPKKCYKKTNNTTKYIKMETSFTSSKTFKERNRKRESSTFFLFGRIYFVNLCFGRC